MPAPDYLHGLRTVPVAGAVVDACRELTALNLIRALVAESVQQRKTTMTALSAELIKGGSAGSGLTRAVLLEVAAGSHSVAEAMGRDLLLRSALPPPEWMTSHGLVVHVPPRRLRIEPTEVLETLARPIAQGLGRPTPAVTDVAPLGWYRSL